MNRTQTKFVKKGKNHYYRNKKIGIIIPTTTRGIDFSTVDDLPFLKTMVPSFRKFCSDRNYYNFYVGYDYNDHYFSCLTDSEARSKSLIFEDFEKNRNSPFSEKYEKIKNLTDALKIVKNKFTTLVTHRYSLTFIKFTETVEKGDLSTMWSILAENAINDGNEYLYQLGDDIDFLSSGWEDSFIGQLEERNNIGVVGPTDEANRTGIITQSFVHSTHLSIFKRYFPEELKNWFIDDWITEIYESGVNRNIFVCNMGGRPRYPIANFKSIKERLVAKDKKIIDKIRKYGKKKIVKIRNNKNMIYMDGSFLSISNKNLSDYNIEFKKELNARSIKKIIRNLGKPEISFYVDGELIHRQGNYISLNEEGTLILQNIENIRLPKNNEEIYLFQQFFIHPEEEHREEIRDCLRRNIGLGIFKKIYLLNERIYTKEELGVDDISSIIQINIGRRLTYKLFMNHAFKLNGYVILSNSDIFFDKSIDNIQTSIMKETKSVQCLRRYEYRGELDLNDCQICNNFESSQDTWIFHSQYLEKNNIEYDIPIGVPGCDNKICELYRYNGYTVLNNYPLLKTYHNHRSQKRNYSMSAIPHPYCFPLNSYPSIPIEEMLKRHNIFWQYPVITEKTFYEQNKDDPNCIGIPWATIIDKKKKLDFEFLEKSLYGNNMYTCCQHIRFRDIIPILKRLKIKKLYTPHKIIGEDDIDGIELQPCPLYAKVVEDDQFEPDPDQKRDILYSFQGGYQRGYLTKTRLNIFNMNHPKIAYVKNTGDWHFNKIVYSDKQNEKGDYNGSDEHFENEKSYLELLKTSHFTLCPSGTGPNSIRFWEALGLGSIPILLANTLELPKHKLWKDTILRVSEKDYGTIPYILKNISKEKEKEMRDNCLIVYNHFRNNYRNL